MSILIIINEKVELLRPHVYIDLINLYVPKEDKEATDLDVVLFHESNNVLESGNYSGWIFGTEYLKCWTQTLPTGREHSRETCFNPFMQNKGHIK